MRKFILISSGILFILAAAGSIIIGAGEKNRIFIILSGMSIPFLFTAYWNIYTVWYENKTGANDEYFTFKEPSGAGIGVFYNKVTVIPFFLILFGSAVLAIITAFLGMNSSTEDISIAVLCMSFVYSLSLTLYFTFRIGRGLNGNAEVSHEISADELGFKIAYFFASIATLGLFPLVHRIVKSAGKNK